MHLKIVAMLVSILVIFTSQFTQADAYRLGPGDVIRIDVYDEARP